MREIDKNDVDVLQLFNWKKEVVLGSSDDYETKIWMRIVGDNDLQRARVYGFRKSSEMRKRLRTEGSDDRVAFLMELEQFADKDVLIETVLLLNIDNYRSEAIKNVDLPLPKEPESDAGIELQEKYQAEVDSYPSRYSEKIAEYMRNKTEEERERLQNVDFAKLYK